jgi:hypothetical protein
MRASRLPHWRLAGCTDTEILCWLDDCSRLALSVTAHRRITATTVYNEFTKAVAHHGIPYSTLTDKPALSTCASTDGQHHIGIGRQHYRTRFLILAQDHHITVINAATGEARRDFTVDPTRDYQPTVALNGPKQKKPRT